MLAVQAVKPGLETQVSDSEKGIGALKLEVEEKESTIVGDADAAVEEMQEFQQEMTEANT